MKDMRIDVQQFYIYTSPFYWAAQILFWTLKVTAITIGFIYRPIRNVFGYLFWVRRYSDEDCKKALKNLETFYKGRKMRYDHKWTFDYCTKRLNK